MLIFSGALASLSSVYLNAQPRYVDSQAKISEAQTCCDEILRMSFMEVSLYYVLTYVCHG